MTPVRLAAVFCSSPCVRATGGFPRGLVFDRLPCRAYPLGSIKCRPGPYPAGAIVSVGYRIGVGGELSGVTRSALYAATYSSAVMPGRYALLIKSSMIVDVRIPGSEDIQSAVHFAQFVGGESLGVASVK